MYSTQSHVPYTDIEGESSPVHIEETQTLDKFKIFCCVCVPWIRCLGLAPSEQKYVLSLSLTLSLSLSLSLSLGTLDMLINTRIFFSQDSVTSVYSDPEESIQLSSNVIYFRTVMPPVRVLGPNRTRYAKTL